MFRNILRALIAFFAFIFLTSCGGGGGGGSSSSDGTSSASGSGTSVGLVGTTLLGNPSTANGDNNSGSNSGTQPPT